MESSVPTALAVVAACVLCIGYLLPHVTRRRIRDAEVPLEDRFSARARVIDPPNQPEPAGRSSAALLGGTSAQRTKLMQRPATSRPVKPAKPVCPDPVSHETISTHQSGTPAAELAAPLSVSELRARAARIRASLALGFLLLTICAVILWATAGLNGWAAVGCGTIALGVLAAGRRAVLLQQKADAQRAERGFGGTAQIEAEPMHDAAARAASVLKAPETVGKRSATSETRPAAAAGAKTSGSTNGRRPNIAKSNNGASRKRAYKLPRPLEITVVEAAPVEADEVLDITPPQARPRRFTTSRPAVVETTLEVSGEVTVQTEVLAVSEADYEINAKSAAEAERAAEANTGAENAGGTIAGSPKPHPSADKTWTPSPIPPPSYTTMAGAPRWEPKPLTAADYAEARRAAASATARAAQEARAEGLESAATGKIKIPERVIFADDALNIDRAITARRRAASN
ncbi:MAG: hypothetical protein LBO75_01205 [Bifidobacteriaceae bacterium]|nr:hypothetical protein [Bifidobacteriaceae bacterium]